MAVNKNKCFTCLRGQEFKMVSIFACDFQEMSHWDKLVTCIPNVVSVYFDFLEFIVFVLFIMHLFLSL